MQDTLDITGAGYEYDFIWLYIDSSILVQFKGYNTGLKHTASSQIVKRFQHTKKDGNHCSCVGVTIETGW